MPTNTWGNCGLFSPLVCVLVGVNVGGFSPTPTAKICAVVKMGEHLLQFFEVKSPKNILELPPPSMSLIVKGMGS